jgi:hypothetical protein
MQEAIRIALCYLRQENTYSCFDLVFQNYNKEKGWEIFRENIKKVSVRFRPWDKKRPEEMSIAWTFRKNNSHTIFINKLFKQRLVHAEKERDEYEHKSIIFGTGVSICHQVAHLALRWLNKLETPDEFDKEMGDFFENHLFARVLTFIRKIPRSLRKELRKEWDENVKIEGKYSESCLFSKWLNKF